MEIFLWSFKNTKYQLITLMVLQPNRENIKKNNKFTKKRPWVPQYIVFFELLSYSNIISPH